MDLDHASATELVRVLADGELSSRELLEHVLSRIERVNPRLNAVVALDVDRARSAAAAADQTRAAGGSGGPLAGLPMTVKDVWETEGLVTTAGARQLKDHRPATDALAVGRLKAAGAIIVGKTNTPEYAGDFQTYNDVYGLTNNPWNTDRTAGGSSGGAAVAVAAGMTPIELGSDIGGSIRSPAHFNGVYGMKPSWGIVPNRGHIPGPPGTLIETDINCGGPLARSVADLGLVLDVIAGPGPEDARAWRLDLDAGPPVTGVAGLRIATVFHEGRDLLPVAGEVTALLEGFAGRLAGAGARVEAVRMPVSLVDGFHSWQDLVLPTIGTAFQDDEFAEFTALEAITGDDPTIRAGRALVSRYRTWLRANDLRQRQRAEWEALFESYDAVLAPVMPTAAFAHDTASHLAERVLDVDGTSVPHILVLAWCGAIGSALLPVVTVPTGTTPDGLPVGVQVIGPYLSDLRLLRLAQVMDEAAGPGFSPPPALGAPDGG